jgi:hypothetical protein
MRQLNPKKSRTRQEKGRLQKQFWDIHDRLTVAFTLQAI